MPCSIFLKKLFPVCNGFQFNFNVHCTTEFVIRLLLDLPISHVRHIFVALSAKSYIFVLHHSFTYHDVFSCQVVPSAKIPWEEVYRAKWPAARWQPN